jgi:hypothetical protein
VLAWWKHWPEANIGIRTGLDSMLVVLDIDVQHGGGGTLAELVKRHGELPAAPEVLTGGGGKHLYFAHPGREIRNSAGKLGPGLDVRGEGGYVIAPPSVHENGRAYKWTRPLGPPPTTPAWLLEDARQHQNGTAPPVERVLPEGQRRQALLSLAGSMRRRGAEADEILAALAAMNENRCRPPLAPTELEELARDVATRYPQEREEPVAELPPLRVVSLSEFAAVDEPSAEPLLGSKQDAVLSAGGTLVFYGDGGAGKTTLGLDLVLHLAARPPLARASRSAPLPGAHRRERGAAGQVPRQAAREARKLGRPARHGTHSRPRGTMGAVHVLRTRVTDANCARCSRSSRST